MDIKLLPIDNCGDCYWHYNVWGEGYYCCYFGKDDNRTLSDDLKIPDWCPLSEGTPTKEK